MMNMFKEEERNIIFLTHFNKIHIFRGKTKLSLNYLF